MTKPPDSFFIKMLCVLAVCGFALGYSLGSMVFNRESLTLQKSLTNELNILTLQTRTALDLSKQMQQEMIELKCLKFAARHAKAAP
jgi:hypothetical protein